MNISPVSPQPPSSANLSLRVAEQHLVAALNELHTQAVDRLPDDHPLLAILSVALDSACVVCPAVRI
jgi:hypothetical protein